MKAAIYARVSTTDKGQDPELQLRPMREYCERMSILWDEFIDHASGVKESRPALDNLMTKLKLREYDVLIVWKLDRLARSLQHLITIVYGELKPRNIGFKVLTQDIDTTTPTGTLIFNVLGALAEFEHDLHSERITEGMKLAKEKGKPIGRKRVAINLPRLLYLYHENRDMIRPAVRAYNTGLPENEQLTPGTGHRYIKGGEK